MSIDMRWRARMAEDAFPLPGAATRRVLVVDDDPAIRRLVRRVLDPSVEVDEAGDGYEGLHRASNADYGVVLLDLHLPGLDGLGVLDRLLVRKPGQAVIVSSCQSDPATRATCLRAGARGFLAKPFSLVDLCTSVSAACDAARPGR